MYRIFALIVFLGTGIYNVYSECGHRTPVILKPFQKTVIESPKSSNGSYLSNSTCSWVVQKSADMPFTMRVMVQIDETEVQCPGDYVRLYDGGSANGPRIFDEFRCNPNVNRSEMHIISGFAFVEFKSDDDDTSSGGFKMTFMPADDVSGDGCTSTTSLVAMETEQFVSSPGFPDDYPLNSDCGWNITTTSNQSVEVVVYFLDIDDSDDCLNRRLEINTNEGTNVLCGVKSWEAKTFASDNISISFKTDSQKRSKGFLIGYKSVTLTTTTTKPTASHTWSPDYFDWLYQDLYKTYPDYYYFDAWNEPLIPNIPWSEPKPAVTTTTTMAPAATIQTSTAHHHHTFTQSPQTSFWDSLWPNVLYWNFFFK